MALLARVAVLVVLAGLPVSAAAQSSWAYPDQLVRVFWDDPHYHGFGCMKLGPRAHLYWSMPLRVAAMERTRHDECGAPLLRPSDRVQDVTAGVTTMPADRKTLVLTHRADPRYHVKGCPYVTKPDEYLQVPIADAWALHAPHAGCGAPAPVEAVRLAAEASPPGQEATRTAAPGSTYTGSSYTGSSGGGSVHVKGYTRKDGTYVKPHTRSRPKRRN